MEKSSKYQGVYFNELKNGDKAYFVVVSEGVKKKWHKVGLHSAGIRELYCFKYRQQLSSQETQTKKSEYTLNEVAEVYYNRDLKSYKKTHDRYLFHFSDNIGKKKLEKIDKTTLIDIDAKTLSPRSKIVLISILKSLFNYAIENELFNGKNPFEKAKMPKASSTRERYLSEDEIKTLIDAVKEDRQLNLFVILALKTGARLETICAIKKADIDEDFMIRLHDFKNNSYYRGYVEASAYKLICESPYELVLQTTPNPAYISRRISKKLQPILNTLFNQGIFDTKNKVVIHTLRHTFASHLAINNTPIYVIQKLMNHSDIKMTLRYAKLSPDSGKEAVGSLFRNVFL